jgi:hypothetical protein
VFQEMIVRRMLPRSLTFSLVLALAPVTLHAQQPGAMDPSQLPPDVQEVFAELKQVQSQIEPIQQEALADPELQAEQAALGEQIQTAMADVNPDMPQQMQRLQELAAEAESAQSEQDQARIGEILTEARDIEVALQDAQAQALQRPDLAPRVQAFQQKVQAKMVEVDPAANDLIQRMGELESRLMALMVQPR